MTVGILEDLRNLLHSRPDYYIDEIQQWFLIAHGTGVSVSTVYRCIIDAGYTYKLLRLRACLRNETEINKRVLKGYGEMCNGSKMDYDMICSM